VPGILGSRPRRERIPAIYIHVRVGLRTLCESRGSFINEDRFIHAKLRKQRKPDAKMARKREDSFTKYTISTARLTDVNFG